MRTTKEEETALIICLYLYRKKSGKKYIPLSEISYHYNISEFFLKKVAKKLKKAGFLLSKEGKNGGYLLKKSPREITIADLISSISGPFHICRCNDNCRTKNCPLTTFWDKINLRIMSVLESYTLTDIKI